MIYSVTLITLSLSPQNQKKKKENHWNRSSPTLASYARNATVYTMASTEAYSEAYLQENRGWIIILVNAVFLALALVFMGLRLYTRLRLLPGTQGLEDWLLTSACVSSISLFFLTYLINYFGTHI